MEFSIKSVSPEKQRNACVVVGVFETRKLTLAAELIDIASDHYLTDVVRRGGMDGKAGTTLLLHDVPATPCASVLLVGLGKEKDFREKEYANAIRSAVKAVKESGAADAVLFLTDLDVRKRKLAWRVRQAAIVARAALYRFDRFKSEKNEASRNEPRRPLRKLVFAIDRRNELAAAETALAEGLAIADGMALARDLGNTPGNVCTPTFLAETAQTIARDHQLDCEILDRADMEKLGMLALLSVAKGSHQPPKLIVMHYRGGGADDQPQVLIGKGITFDSGGISLKPGAEMDEMKFDMCGAASVLGTLKAVAQMKLPLNLTVIVPASENMPGGAASKPGDIVTSLSGQTIEILNTDAEGRLVLCDALTYAERFDPANVVDVATLTGACVIALGHVATGLFANHDSLAKALLLAGEDAQDRAWQMPLWDDYQDLLKSNFADMANIGGRAAGSVSAACFLSRFAKKFHWAHLDIAGTAWKSGAEKGATGRPVALLAHYLLHRAGKLD
ncbi:MAG: leucyl aminopeptidase [Propionivibrio sp.]